MLRFPYRDFLYSDNIILSAINHYGEGKGMKTEEKPEKSNINCLLLSLHLEIRNNDRINLDYRLL
jgi:hypothetical protein